MTDFQFQDIPLIPEKTEEGQALLAAFEEDRKVLIERIDLLRNECNAAILQRSQEMLQALLSDAHAAAQKRQEQLIADMMAIDLDKASPVAPPAPAPEQASGDTNVAAPTASAEVAPGGE